MAAVAVDTQTPTELLATGRRHLAVKDFTSAVETLASACELLAKEHGEAADQCAEAYLWYGKSLLGLSREESGVLGDGVPGTGNADEEDDEEENGENDDEQNGEAESDKQNGESETNKENGDIAEKSKNSVAAEKSQNGDMEAENSVKVDEKKPESNAVDPDSSMPDAKENEDTAENGADPKDESTVNMDDDDVDNLQLAWEMLDLARSILYRRVQDGGGDAARALLADVHLALGEVALESETYDKAVVDMQSCLDLQKELYRSDDRRIAETHYQIALANSLASNFEDAITHFKNAANILETRIRSLESPTSNDDATVKKYTTADPMYSIEGEIKELKELLPEIQDKIQDMMEYKAETVKRVREALFGTDEAPKPLSFSSSSAVGSSSSAFGSSSAVGSSSSAFGTSSAVGSSSAFSSSAFGSSSIGASSSKPAADITHLIKRKRKPSEEEKNAAPVAKKTST